MKRWFLYFRTPFPGTAGFAPYRFPGLIVHIPVIGVSLLIGLLILGKSPALLPLLLVYLIVGIFLGRDFAIVCHYAPLLAAAFLVVSFAVVACLKGIAAAVDTLRTKMGLAPEAFSISVTAALVAFFAFCVFRHVGRETTAGDLA